MNQFDKCEFMNQFKIKSSVLSNFFQLKFLEMMSAHKKITSELGLYCLSDSEVAILSWLVGPASRLHQQFLWNSLTWSNDASTPVVCDASSRGNMLAFPFFEPFRLWWVNLPWEIVLWTSRATREWKFAQWLTESRCEISICSSPDRALIVWTQSPSNVLGSIMTKETWINVGLLCCNVYRGPDGEFWQVWVDNEPFCLCPIFSSRLSVVYLASVAMTTVCPIDFF